MYVYRASYPISIMLPVKPTHITLYMKSMLLEDSIGIFSYDGLQ